MKQIWARTFIIITIAIAGHKFALGQSQQYKAGQLQQTNNFGSLTAVNQIEDSIAVPPKRSFVSGFQLFGLGGFVWAHNKDVVNVGQYHNGALQLDLILPKIQNSIFRERFGNAKGGLSFQYYNLGNQHILGQAYTITTFLSPAIIRTKKLSIYGRLGSGLTYATKTFDKETNFQYQNISSSISICMQAMGTVGYAITPDTELLIGLSLTHFSNGAFKTPNNGLNLPALNIGLCYKPNTWQHKLATTQQEVEIGGKNSLFTQFGTGFVQILPVGGTTYPVYEGGLYLDRRVNMVSSFNIGTEVMFNNSLKAVALQDPLLPHNSPIRLGATFGYQLHLGRTSLVTQVGYYYYKPLPLDIDIYNRIGLRYTYKNYATSVLLKIHGFKAECITLNVGRHFRWGKPVKYHL